jgi:actin-related protein
VLTGGSSVLAGLGEHLVNEVTPLMNGKTVAVPSMPERRNAAWAGASLMANLSSFDALWMRSSDYEDSGATAIHRICLPVD